MKNLSLVFTFDINSNKGIPDRLNRIRSFYSHSINSAKNLGYKTEIYSNCDWFDELVDKKHYVQESFFFWDGFKTLALQREDNFLLVDGDITFKKEFQEFNSEIDLYFDTYESWYKDYKNTVTELTNLGVKDIIPEWNDIPKPVINIGILRINNKELRELYLERWYSFQEFCFFNRARISNIHHCCTIGSQYILTLLAENYSKHYFSQKVKVPNQFYIHHWGEDKYNRPLPKFTSSLF